MNGLGIKGWSDHVQFHYSRSLQEAIDIAIERLTFNDCSVCRQNSKYNLSSTVHTIELRHENFNTSYYKLTKQTSSNNRFKPYVVSKMHS